MLAQGSTNKTDAYVSTNCLFISAVRLLEARYGATILVLVNITINSLFKYRELVLAQYPAQPQSKGGCQKHPTCVARGGVHSRRILHVKQLTILHRKIPTPVE